MQPRGGPAALCPGGTNRLTNPGLESGNTAWNFDPTPPFTILQNP